MVAPDPVLTLVHVPAPAGLDCHCKETPLDCPPSVNVEVPAEHKIAGAAVAVPGVGVPEQVGLVH